MPRRAHVEPWLPELELLEWVRASEFRAACQRWLAAWLTYLRQSSAHELVTLLGVSAPAMWRRLLFLPPCSTELNPVESVWEYLRENHFGNDTFPHPGRGRPTPRERPALSRPAAQSGPLPDVLRLARYCTAVVTLR